MHFPIIRPQYFGVTEQMLLSASNMIASLIVVKAADMSSFGIYSFIFVWATLAGAFLSTLLHRQMILEIASSSDEIRRRVFLSTLLIQTVILASLAIILLVLLSVFASTGFVQQFQHEIVSASVFVCMYAYYDLCRQYLYVLDGQAYSFRCTVIYVAVLFSGFVWLASNAEFSSIVASMYYLFSVGLLISLLSNRWCQREFSNAQWLGWTAVRELVIVYFAQGRYRLTGMLITWAQNQSMNPILMWLSGPLVAGFFSMARLMVMPMAVVNQGLTNSTTPQLRRIYQNEGAGELLKAISRYNLLNLGFSALYLVALAAAHVGGLLHEFVPDYDEVKWYLLIWIVTLLVTMYRYWLGQFHVVSMQFRFMMNVSALALFVSMSGMLGIGVVWGNVHLALMFIVVGELLTIALFNNRRRSELRDA